MYLDLLKQEQRFRLPFWRLNDREKGMTNAFCIAAAFSKKIETNSRNKVFRRKQEPKKMPLLLLDVKMLGERFSRHF